MAYKPVPFKKWFLPEMDGHTVAVYEYGNPAGIPVIVSHGGPGDKSKPKHVACFDLTTTWVIAYDQRGCGNSMPNGRLDNNTTFETIQDIERIRTTLKINDWFVSGGSWGSTLSILYAQHYPDKVRGLLLTSIFLADKQSEDWAFANEGGAEVMFSDVWQHRKELLEKYQTNSQDFSKKLLPLLKDVSDPQTLDITSRILSWEGNLMTSQDDIQYFLPSDIGESEINSVKIMLHYESNSYFMTEDQILNKLDSIKNVPTLIVHGRYDVLCPLKFAWKLHQQLPKSDLIILPSSGHRLTAEGLLARSLAYQKFLMTH